MSRLPQVNRRKLGREHADGLWDGRAITVDARLSGRRELSVLLHEGLHWACGYMDESEVDRVSAALARLAWRDGYRRERNTR